MIIIVAMSLILTIAGCLIYHKGCKTTGDHIINIIVSAAIGAALGLIFSMIISSYAPYKEQLIELNREEIVALNLANETSGNFFLGCGSFQDDPYYYFYKQTCDNAKIFTKEPAEFTYIYEENRHDAYLAQIYEMNVYKNQKLMAALVPGWILNNRTFSRTVIHVPKGTIKNQGEFNMDIKKL